MPREFVAAKVADTEGHNRRCSALGLPWNDCTMPAVDESPYCYYHTKVQKGLTTPESWEAYPMLPLPEHGYNERKKR